MFYSLCNSHYVTGKSGLVRRFKCEYFYLIDFKWDYLIWSYRVSHKISVNSRQTRLPIGMKKADSVAKETFSAYFYCFFGRFCSFLCKVRRCMPRLRAAADILLSCSLSVRCICSHSKRLIDMGVASGSFSGASVSLCSAANI